MLDRETPKPIYTERYVAFIDILGFSDIVRHSVESPEQASALVRTLEKISTVSKGGIVDDLLGTDFRAQSFSDCIVLSEVASDSGLEWLLEIVSALARDLLANGILTRGGIAKGKLHHTDKIVFGPSLVEAYRLENAIADYPRIVVDRATHRDFVQLCANGRADWVSPTLGGHLRYDDDGPVFVDIFAPLRDLSHAAPKQFSVTAASCRASIQNLLNESIYQPRIYKKLRWLAVYWNGVVLGQPETDLLEPVDFPTMSQLR